MKTCKDLNIKLCPVCNVASFSYPSNHDSNCWVTYYSNYIKTHSYEDIKIFCLARLPIAGQRIIGFENWMYFLSKTIELLHPEYKDMFDKLLVLL